MTESNTVPTAPANLRFRVPGMDCAAEEMELRHALEIIPGVSEVTARFSDRTLSIRADSVDLATLALSAIRKAGFEAEPLDEEAVASDLKGDDHAGDHQSLSRLVLALTLAIGAELIGILAPDVRLWTIVGGAVAATAIALAGFEVYKKGLIALFHGRLNINALMTVAVTGAFVIGQWPEAAMVMALYAIAEAIEARAAERARNAIKGLLDMAPEQALVKDASGGWSTLPVAQVAIGAIVQTRPGERIPLDGTVRSGQSSVNQAPVTGESIPVDKGPGDAVFAGTINESGTFEFDVTALASNSTLARIIQSVEQAQASRAPTQGFVERFAAIYTPAVFIIALVVGLVGPSVFGWTWLQSAYKALVLLVIACPCALVISTPVTIVSGLAAAARKGILVKGGVHLENARLIRAIALDKTGTITEGKPELVARDSWPSDFAGRWEGIAAALAGHSDHPVSKAISRGLSPPTVQPENFRALPGRGVQAEVQGVRYLMGNHRLIEERGLCTPELEASLALHEQAGRTVTVLASEQTVLALFAVADTIKSSSREAIEALTKLGIRPVMLTGDNQATAAAIALQAGITEARGNLLPQEKLEAVKSLQREHGKTAMTGDGINDAPALAQADIGIAMGAAGTDTAVEAADVVVMTDDLRRISWLVTISRSTHAILWQNISLALGIKAVFLVLAVFGSASMWMAVFADMGASLLVVANGMRLLRTRG